MDDEIIFVLIGYQNKNLSFYYQKEILTWWRRKWVSMGLNDLLSIEAICKQFQEEDNENSNCDEYCDVEGNSLFWPSLNMKQRS